MSVNEDEDGERAAETETLLSHKPILSLSRYYILIMYSFLTFNQCLFWFTYGSATTIQTYYNMPSSTIDLLLNWGPIIFLLVVPFASWILSRKNGIRIALLLGAVTCTLACFLRLVPCFFSASVRQQENTWIWIHVGQILNAGVGGLAMASPSRVAGVWFPASERTRACAVIYLGGSVGSAVGFVLGPWLVPDPDDTPHLLLVELALALILLIAACLYAPDHPPHPPSHSMSLVQADSHTHALHKWEFLQQAGKVFRNPSVVLLVIAGGLEAGASAGWSGVLTQIMVNDSANFVGWAGFLNNVAGIGGILLSGFLGDRLFRKKFKRLLMLLFIGTVGSYIWFTLQLADPFASSPPLPSSRAYVLVAIALAGAFQGALDPLYYELCAEITYPLSESITAGFITFASNATSLILFFVAPQVPILWLNTLTTGAMLISAVCTMLAREEYRRTNTDDQNNEVLASKVSVND